MRIGIPAAVMSVAAAVLIGGSSAEAGTPLFVKRFLIGRLEEGTNRFIATGARGSDQVARDSLILIVFSRRIDLTPVEPTDPHSDFVHVNHRTVQIGIPAAAGLILREPEGRFTRYEVRKFNPSTGTYELKRSFRNRVLFDPTGRFGPAIEQNPYGFEANSLYAVTVPGVDQGYLKTVVDRRGEPNALTFTSTFRTSSYYFRGSDRPGP